MCAPDDDDTALLYSLAAKLTLDNIFTRERGGGREGGRERERERERVVDELTNSSALRGELLRTVRKFSVVCDC